MDMILKRANSSVPLWLDCDTGHDDAFAILLAAQQPSVQLLGVSTVYGNAPLENTTFNTRAILKAVGREDIPVYAGAARPIFRDAAHAPDIHGASGLDGTTCLPTPTVPSREDVPAVEAMYQALMSQPAGTAWLVATGSLTNIAELFTTHPDLVSHLAGLSIMGGAIGGGFTDAPLGTVTGRGEQFGNHTPYAEFNIYCDPEAANIVLSQPALAAKTTLIPLDITHKFLATTEIQQAILFGFHNSACAEPTLDTASPLRLLFFEIVTFFARTYADVFGLTAGPPAHDPLAVAVAFAPHLFHFRSLDPRDGEQPERFQVSVITEGEHGSSAQIRNGPSQCGRTIATAVPQGDPGIRIPRELDARQLWAMIEGCLTRAESLMEDGNRMGKSRMRPRNTARSVNPSPQPGTNGRNSPRAQMQRPVEGSWCAVHLADHSQNRRRVTDSESVDPEEAGLVGIGASEEKCWACGRPGRRVDGDKSKLARRAS